MWPAIWRTPALAGVFVGAVLISGCASFQLAPLPKNWPTNLPSALMLGNIPFLPQQDYECGPAALAMVLQAIGVDATPEQLVEQVYLPGRKGALQVEMMASVRRHGQVSYNVPPRLEDLLQEVAAGHPVLVLQNLSLPLYPVWHYAVVIGYDRERSILLLHSGRTPELEVSFFTFEQTWARSGHWAMVALPPDQLPATGQASTVAPSIAALERLNPQAARIAYTNALRRWPGERTLLLGAGNTAYALGALDVATDTFLELTEKHPDFAPGWNNLAQSLLDQHLYADAAVAIDKAIARGGTQLPIYQRLQDKISRLSAGEPPLAQRRK